jgi:hypothetical protein
MEKQESSNTSKEEEKNQALSLRYHDDIFQKGKLEVAHEILSNAAVKHMPSLFVSCCPVLCFAVHRY